MKKNNPCPCGSGQTYDSCCAILHSGGIAVSAESLMRSRYAAFTSNNETYLLNTWHKTTRPKALNLSEQNNIKWIGLKVLNHNSDGNSATVEFIARYKANGKAEKIHELSRFIAEDGRWLYIDGDNMS